MRIRTYGFVLLILVAVVPLVAFGILATRSAGDAAVDEVRAGNQRLADSIAERIEAYLDSSRQRLALIGAATRYATDAPAMLQALTVDARYLREVVVIDEGGELLAGSADGPSLADQLDQALAGTSSWSAVHKAPAGEQRSFAHTVTVVEPVIIAGEVRGAVAAVLDLVDVWSPINQARVGAGGFVRLLSRDGVLLAHGHPEERRHVFAESDQAALLTAAEGEDTTVTPEGNEVILAAAEVSSLGWKVLVEQSVAEALDGVQTMKRQLALLSAMAVVLAMVIAWALGRRTVADVERLERHTRRLARGDLTGRNDARPRIAELRTLSVALDRMAESLDTLHREARAKERVTTFGRVAAGLTHDLRQPIEALRMSIETTLADPDDEAAMEIFRWVSEHELPKLSGYLEDLRRLATEGDLAVEAAAVEPASMVEEIASELRGAPKWRGVEFETSGAAPSVRADYRLVRRAVFNLAANAADACVRNRGGTVELRVREHDGGVMFDVADDGGGMEPELLIRVLEGDFHSTKRTSGIGLGLGVVRHVAEVHQGRLMGESQPGEGSRLSLWLPPEPPSQKRL